MIVQVAFPGTLALPVIMAAVVAHSDQNRMFSLGMPKLRKRTKNVSLPTDRSLAVTTGVGDSKAPGRVI